FHLSCYSQELNDTATKVILFSYTNYPSLLSNLEKEGVKMGQNDLLRHGSFTFDLQGVSRAASHQIVRHRIASFYQQSQRYLKINGRFETLHGQCMPPSASSLPKYSVRSRPLMKATTSRNEYNW